MDYKYLCKAMVTIIYMNSKGNYCLTEARIAANKIGALPILIENTELISIINIDDGQVLYKSKQYSFHFNTLKIRYKMR